MLEEKKPNLGNSENLEVKPPEPTPEPVKKQEMPTPEVKPVTPLVEPKKEEPLTIDIEGQKLTVDELKAGYMRQRDYTQKTQDLADYKRKVEAVTEVLTPREEPEVKPPSYLTKEELDKFLEERDQRRDQQLKLKSEIESLQKEFTGEDSRPKYEDDKILKWQQENNKMYLSPREAFEKMYKNEFLEYEVQQRLKKAGKPTFQEKPGGGTELKMPEEKKAFITEKGEEDSQARRKALLETWDNMESEL